MKKQALSAVALTLVWGAVACSGEFASEAPFEYENEADVGEADVSEAREEAAPLGTASAALTGDAGADGGADGGVR